MKIHQEVLENTNSLKPRGYTGPDGIRDNVEMSLPEMRTQTYSFACHVGCHCARVPISESTDRHEGLLSRRTGDQKCGLHLNHMRNIKFHMHKRLIKKHPQQPTHFCHCNLPSNWIRGILSVPFPSPPRPRRSELPLGPGTLPASPVGMSPAPPV